MKLITFGIVVLFSFKLLVAQDISGSLLLEKAIQYHDPNQQWTTFKGEFDIVMEMPNESNRSTKIQINLPLEYFYINSNQDDVHYEFTVNKGECGVSIMSASAIKKFGAMTNTESCERAKLYKNYYTYLYGLPMKLNDEGTNVSETVERKTFKGKAYLVLKVTYDEAVGNDVWYFYFNPKTYAMEIYQFFKTDAQGNLKLDSGEYIMLSETETINQIKTPKVRAWYYNKNDAYLATDTLEK